VQLNSVIAVKIYIYLNEKCLSSLKSSGSQPFQETIYLMTTRRCTKCFWLSILDCIPISNDKSFHGSTFQAQRFHDVIFGVTKLRPTGQIRPSKPFDPTREVFHAAEKAFCHRWKSNIFTKNLWIGRMQHIPKQSRYVRCTVLELLDNSLCGPSTKKFGDLVL